MQGAAKLFVGCLPYSKTDADLSELFGQFGQLQEVAILKKPDGTSKGAAFVTFVDSQAAATAMMMLNNHLFDGSTRGINISVAGSGARQPTAAQVYGIPQPPLPMMTPQSYAMAPQPQPGQPVTKLFVGQLPYSKSEADLRQLFSSVGPVLEVFLVRDKATGEKKGAAFVKYQSAQVAAAAVSVLDGYLFPGSPRPITVSMAKVNGAQAMPVPTAVKREFGQPYMAYPAGHQGVSVQTGSSSLEGCKLFVGQLPFSRTEQDIAQVFGQYGQVQEVVMHRNPATGQKKGAAFVYFATSDAAVAALQLDGFLFPGATRTISVCMAGENKRQRIA